MNVLLSTLNSKFIHSSLALRYLEVYGRTKGYDYKRVEYTINMPILDILNDITEKRMDIVGFACYIWNIDMTLHLADLIKSVLPNVVIVLGGPEVSYTADEILLSHPSIDYIIQGEGEEAFSGLVDVLLAKQSPFTTVVPGVRACKNGVLGGSTEIVEVKDLSVIPFPYTETDIQELANKIIYYESSRGCPFSCQYCLSGNKNTVRFFPLERTLTELQWFIDHEVKQIKFVDRTFNCAPHHHIPIMEFISQADTKTNFHLEMEADLIRAEEVKILSESPKGRIQIEVGVQSTYDKTLTAIHRRNNWAHIQEVIKPIIKAGQTHVHMDLIIGLPHEDFKRFEESFNDLFSLQPDALQLGFLKLLKGSGVRQMTSYEYVCDSRAPYEVLSTHVLPYEKIRFLKHFEDVFERFYNSERFRTLFGYIGKQIIDSGESAFQYFCDMTKSWLREGNHKVKLNDKSQLIFLYKFFQSRKDKIACELLRYDTVRSYGGKVRPIEIGIPPQTKEQLQESEAFWRDETTVRQYIPNFTFREWRRIRQDYCELAVAKDVLPIIGITLTAEEIDLLPDSDIPVIIDITDKNKPFIRPNVENIEHICRK